MNVSSNQSGNGNSTVRAFRKKHNVDDSIAIQQQRQCPLEYRPINKDLKRYLRCASKTGILHILDRDTMCVTDESCGDELGRDGKLKRNQSLRREMRVMRSNVPLLALASFYMQQYDILGKIVFPLVEYDDFKEVNHRLSEDRIKKMFPRVTQTVGNDTKTYIMPLNSEGNYQGKFVAGCTPRYVRMCQYNEAGTKICEESKRLLRVIFHTFYNVDPENGKDGSMYFENFREDLDNPTSKFVSMEKAGIYGRLFTLLVALQKVAKKPEKYFNGLVPVSRNRSIDRDGAASEGQIGRNRSIDRDGAASEGQIGRNRRINRDGAASEGLVPEGRDERPLGVMNYMNQPGNVIQKLAATSRKPAPKSLIGEFKWRKFVRKNHTLHKKLREPTTEIKGILDLDQLCKMSCPQKGLQTKKLQFYEVGEPFMDDVMEGDTRIGYLTPKNAIFTGEQVNHSLYPQLPALVFPYSSSLANFAETMSRQVTHLSNKKYLERMNTLQVVDGDFKDALADNLRLYFSDNVAPRSRAEVESTPTEERSEGGINLMRACVELSIQNPHIKTETDLQNSGLKIRRAHNQGGSIDAHEVCTVITVPRKEGGEPDSFIIPKFINTVLMQPESTPDSDPRLLNEHDETAQDLRNLLSDMIKDTSETKKSAQKNIDALVSGGAK